MLHRLTEPKDFVLENDPAVDQDAWDDIAKKNYFLTNYDLPPLKAGDPPTYFTLKPLCGAAMREAKRRMDRHLKENGDVDIVAAFGDVDFTELVCAHGLIDIKNYGGFKPVFEQGPYGQKLDQASMDEIFPFVPGLDVQIASIIMSLSRLRFT